MGTPCRTVLFMVEFFRKVYNFFMAINIKNPEVERLVEEVTAKTGETKTEAIRKALEERSERLALYPAQESRRERVERFLRQEVWPYVPKKWLGKRISKAEKERILGYGPHGV